MNRSDLEHTHAAPGRVESALTPVASLLARGGLAAWQSKRINIYVMDNLGSKIRVADLAGLTRLSVSYFSVAFGLSFGTTALAYVTACRIERAQGMMRSTAQKLSRIALECGFSDQAHLSRRFRSVVGTTPLRWRQKDRLLRSAASAEASLKLK